MHQVNSHLQFQTRRDLGPRSKGSLDTPLSPSKQLPALSHLPTTHPPWLFRSGFPHCPPRRSTLRSTYCGTSPAAGWGTRGTAAAGHQSRAGCSRWPRPCRCTAACRWAGSSLRCGRSCPAGHKSRPRELWEGGRRGGEAEQMVGGQQHGLCLRGSQGSWWGTSAHTQTLPCSAIPVLDAAEVGAFHICLPGPQAIPDIDFGSWLQLCQTSQNSLEKSLLHLDELLSGTLSLQLVNSLFSSQRSSCPAQRVPRQRCCARCIPDTTHEPAALLLVTLRRPKATFS